MPFLKEQNNLGNSLATCLDCAMPSKEALEIGNAVGWAGTAVCRKESRVKMIQHVYNSRMNSHQWSFYSVVLALLKCLLNFFLE